MGGKYLTAVKGMKTKQSENKTEVGEIQISFDFCFIL